MSSLSKNFLRAILAFSLYLNAPAQPLAEPKTSEFENPPKKVSMTYFNGLENEELIQVFDPQKICEHCNQKGSFVIENDPIVGVCYQTLQKIYTNIEEIKE